MKNYQKIIFISGNTASVGHRFRVTHKADALEANGYRTETYDLKDVTDSFLLPECDMLVIFRAAWNHHLNRLVEVCNGKKIPVIFDIDDLLFDADILHNGYWAYYDELPEEDRYLWLLKVKGYQKTLERCDAALLSTQPLKTAASRFCPQTWLLPNTLDKHLVTAANNAKKTIKPSEIDGKTRVGFASGTPTHKKDFGVAVQGISRILGENNNIILTILGALNPAEYPVLAPYMDRVEIRPHVNTGELASEVHRFDINLAPLEINNPFCASKSALRCIMASIVEIPSVVSPTQPLREAVEEGKYGLIARNDEEWYQGIHTLIENTALRNRLGTESNINTLQNFGPEAGASMTLDVFDAIIRDWRSYKN
jgi:glycosyltransferase involved in cell wall biosynthesis